MKLSLKSVLTVCLLVLGLGTAEAAPNKVASAKALKSRTVALVSTADDGAVHPYCAGVWISKNAILTAAHCVDEDEMTIDYALESDIVDAATPTVRTSIVVARDTVQDLAVLRVENPPQHAVAALMKDKPQAGQFVQTIGFPLGVWWSYSSGDISGTPRLDVGQGERAWVQTTTPTGPGSSGGGLFNEAHELVGICSQIHPAAQNVTLFVHPQYIKTFVVGRL